MLNFFAFVALLVGSRSPLAFATRIPFHHEKCKMAEAAVESLSTRFFCHKCTQEINPVLPDYTCPRCCSGFIEELGQTSLENPNDYSEDDADPDSQFVEIWGRSLFGSLGQLNAEEGSTSRDERSGPSSSSSTSQHRRPGAFIPRTRVSIRRRSPVMVDRPPSIEGLLQQIFSHLTSGAGAGQNNTAFPVSFLNLHGNPGDYAWGRGGLDTIITQLLNQLDGTGPPPLPQDRISRIPMVNISKEQVDKTLQCTVCMEDFRQGEPVRRLLCQHHFHNDCIVPWLELHGTCPICRKYLNDDDEYEDDDLGPESSSHPTSQSQSVYFTDDCD
uniref:RING-type E3 ubiquitin transferase n=1 Tax=Strigamia maritima TaxID=126957 RepID=T1IPA9_STRMM